jgi:branched-chain amino acid transport system substrate-binding protein
MTMGKLSRRDFTRAAATTLIAPLAAPAIVGTAKAQAKTLVFGGSVPLSGRAAETGLNVHAGYQTAVKFVNEQGGVEIGGTKYRLELKMFDDASDPSRATTLIQKQIDEGTNFFLGSFGSNIVLPTAAITERARRPMVQAGGGSDQIFTQGHKYIFGLFPRAAKQFISSVEFLKGLSPKPQTASVILTNDAFSRTSADGAIADLKAAGFEVLDRFTLPEQVSDASSVLNTVRSRTPDVLICTTHDQDSLLIARQMVATDTNVKLLYQGLGPQLATYREALGKYANGVVTQIYWDERLNFKDEYFGTAAKFATYYKANNPRPIAYHTAAGASCIVAYLHAMKQAKSIEPRPVRDALSAIDVETAYGRIKFTKDGDGDPVLLGARIGQVQKGNIEVVFPAEGGTAKPAYPTPAWKEKT